MKKSIFSFCAFLLFLSVSAQEAKKITKSSISTVEDAKLAVIDRKMETGTSWISSYNATLAVLNKAETQLRSNNLKNLDALANEAETLLQPIVSLAPENSEITVLKAYIHLIRMGKNGSDFQTERQKARELLYLEVNSDPANPRFNLLRAELHYLTQKNMKSDKNLKDAFINAAKVLKSFKPASADAPSWGLADAQYYISIIK